MPASSQGSQPTRYHLIPRTLIFATRPGEVLLIKGAAHKRLWAGLFNGIGGHIEQGEDVLTAARREFFEETGLHLERAWICGVVIVDTGQSPGITLFVLRGEASSGKLQHSAEGELAWMPVNRELYTLPLVEDLPVLLPHVLDQQPCSAPFSVLYHYDQDGHLHIHFFGEED
jgi:8-oxo-dGTP diphosphatase